MNRTPRSRRSAACTRATARARPCWWTTASACPARWTTGRSISRNSRPCRTRRIYVSATPGPRELEWSPGPGRRADHPSHRPARSQGHRQAAQGPDRRPDRDAASASKKERVLVTTLTKRTAEELDRLPARHRHQGALPAQRHRHHRAREDPARLAQGRVRRAGGHQSAARGARPAGGVAGGDSRRGQGRLSAQRPRA